MVQKKKIKLNNMKMKSIKRNLAVIVLLLVTGVTSIVAQESKYGSDPEKCKMNISLFHESVKAKNYAEAEEPWRWVYENCPKATKYIYTDGLKIALDKLKKGDATAENLVNEIYTKRLQYYPENAGKVYSDWASFLIKQKASDDTVFEKLNAAFKADPAGMSVKNIFRFFKQVVDKYKDTDTQKVFDTYDEVVEAVNKKIKKLTTDYATLQKKIDAGQTLSKREKWYVDHKYYEKNLEGLGKVQGGLDGMVESIATCDRLIPLYKKSYEANKSNIIWLKRAAQRLNKKGCSDDPFFVTLIEDWSKADPTSISVLKYLESIYRKQGRIAEADELAKRIFNLGSPEDKARFVYGKAQALFNAHKYAQASRKAREVLKYDPNFGKAYILIGRAYQKSANSCGNNEFEKRMVYVAAANKMAQAKRVDPSVSSLANRYMKNYIANYPSKTLIFQRNLKTGDKHKIGCWIGETVRIP
jgi:tetratricopeptide (TPR) repeat protein